MHLIGRNTLSLIGLTAGTQPVGPFGGAPAYVPVVDDTIGEWWSLLLARVKVTRCGGFKPVRT